MSHTSKYPRNRVVAMSSDEMMTKQSHKDECDIHKILGNYKKTGIINHITSRQPIFADLPDQCDYQDAIEVVRDAQEAFAELPATVRDRFDNDPANLLAALSDPNLKSELQELGVLKRDGVVPSTPPNPAGATPGGTNPAAKPDGVQ